MKYKMTYEQAEFAAELCETYGIDPDEVLFFTEDSRPFLTYEATCSLCNRLTELRSINIEPVKTVFPDSLSMKCTLTLASGDTRSAVGVANLNEEVDGKKLTEAQAYQLASSRAIRAALRTAGIDLLKLHNQQKTGFSGEKQKSNFNTLLGQAHKLGAAAGLIVGDDKSAWRTILSNRYGVFHSNHLAEDELADFVAVLSTLAPKRRTV
ncbi:MAG: hypothetical protein KIS76_04000 [Pyrinomonadaceae bacterium]|nr:hypothetical protein [Pyrinomonadaceae bacterium]